MSRRSAAVALSGAYAALATLFATGALRRPDQWAVDHWMPGIALRRAEPGVVDAIVPLLHSRWDNGYAIAANLLTLPASLLVSILLATLLSRRLAVALVAATAVEVLCKTVIAGPDLFHGTSHIVAFDSSFPSGHTLRTVILAGAVALSRPQLRLLAAAWAVAAIVLLELAGWHTPTDIAGGVVLGALVVWPVTLPGSWVASTKRWKDAGSADSPTIGATEDAPARRVLAGQGPGERCRLHH